MCAVLAAGPSARADDEPPERYSSRVKDGPAAPAAPEERAGSEVTRRDMERRLPASTPEALRFEAGVFVQQTAHGQASVYLRGLTGQDVVLSFDGIRLNNSVYRQGPNQYLFTVDQNTLSLIEVLRGGGSTRWGSDAVGGAILARPVEPPRPEEGALVQPLVFARTASADQSIGGRAQVGFGWTAPGGAYVGFIGGAGARRADLLESSGSVRNPVPDTPVGPYPWVPRFAPDGRTQLGTGYKELTGDARLVLRLLPRDTLTAAIYLYREYDAPRTDNCPAPTAPYNVCLTYEQQFRHLAYVKWDGSHGPLARRLRLSLSWQQQHERRRLDTPSQFTQLIGEDDIDTAGVAFTGSTDRFRVAPWLGLGFFYGVDSWHDWVRSSAVNRYTDVKIDSVQSRGQYMSGSRYLQGGAFLDGEAQLPGAVTVRAGVRASWVTASAPADPESGTRAVDAAWHPVVGHAGIEWRPLPWLHLLGNYDNSFRAPNLDDLTSRQQTGPGFQFENAALGPLRGHTIEAGARVRASWIESDVWLYETVLEDTMLKQPKGFEDCPAATPLCQNAWSRYQLINAPAVSEVRGVEAMARAWLPGSVRVRATLTYTWGEGPRVGVLPNDLGITLGERIPLSRIPPLNGTVELTWLHRSGISLGGTLRWATLQDRLALQDYSDGRIPLYGTPGFAVVDLQAGYQVGGRASANLVIENLLDSPYRYHGSSINGAARGILFSLRLRMD